MGVEHLRTKRVLQEAKPKRKIIAGFDEAAKGIVRWFTENAGIASPPQYHPDYLPTLIDAAKDGLILDYMGSHTAWGDIILLSFVTREGIGIANEHLPANQQIEGAVAPFAKTMQTEKQGKSLSFMFQATLPLLTTNRVYPVYTATERDVLIRNEQKNGQEFMADMYSMMSEGFSAIAVLPEGSVEGGRKRPDGKRVGMQLVQEGTAASAVILAKRLKRPGVLYVPVGIEGGFEINDPTNRLRFPTIEGFKAGFLLKKGVCKIRVGKPIRSDDPEIAAMIKERAWGKLDDMIGFAIAEQVSPHMRAVYTNEQTLAQAKLKREQARQATSTTILSRA